MLAGQHLAAVI